MKKKKNKKENCVSSPNPPTGATRYFKKVKGKVDFRVLKKSSQ